MPRRSIRELELDGRRVLVRVDFNVPLDAAGRVADDGRIRAALPTLEHALERGAALVLMTHLGRPKGDPAADRRLHLDAVADALRAHLPGRRVQKVDAVAGDAPRKAAEELGAGELLLLENLRLQPGEKANDETFAGELARLGELYVNDAFATCHRAHASVDAVPRRFAPERRGMGLLVERELEAIGRAREAPEDPLVLVIGGAKAEDKVGVIEALGPRAAHVLVGGACAYPLMRARGVGVGSSEVSEEGLRAAERAVDAADGRIVLPDDHVLVRPGEEGEPHVAGEIPEGWAGRDIGPRTRETFAECIAMAGTVLWSGPMGRFEEPPFDEGTRHVAAAVAEAPGFTVVGGGRRASRSAPGASRSGWATSPRAAGPSSPAWRERPSPASLRSSAAEAPGRPALVGTAGPDTLLAVSGPSIPASAGSGPRPSA